MFFYNGIEDTIFALSTVFGKSGVAVFRISGKSAVRVVKDLGFAGDLRERYCYYTKISDPVSKKVIDNVLLIYFAGPKSFTGEDVIEIHCHGSKAVIKILTQIFENMDYLRVAMAGEFAKRSFLNGKIDLTEAEGLVDLIDAETEFQHQQAMGQVCGNLKNLYEQWNNDIIGIRAIIEAAIEFPEDIEDDKFIDHIDGEITKLIQSIDKHLADSERGQKLRSGIHVVITGAPNVGKSSLLNQLADKDIAITSDIAGTTRDVIEVYLDLFGYPVIIADTAGIRDTSDKLEFEGVKRAQEKLNSADIKIILVDVNNINELDQYTNNIGENDIIVCNKIDLDDRVKLHSSDITYISIAHNIGIKNLLNILKSKVINVAEFRGNPVITRQRYRTNLKLCVNDLYACEEQNIPLDFKANLLISASNYLGSITGKITTDDVLDSLFSNFCIGK